MTRPKYYLLPADTLLDARHLLRILWRSKKSISIISCLAGVCALVYVLMIPTTYEARMETSLPDEQAFAPINANTWVIQNSLTSALSNNAKITLIQPTSNWAYALFLKHLISEQMRVEFFENYYLPQYYSLSTQQQEKLWASLNNNLIVSISGSGDSQKGIVQARGKNQDENRKLIIQFLRATSEFTSTKIVETLQSELNLLREILAIEIDFRRQVAINKQESQIELLRQAFDVAKTLGIKDPILNAPTIINVSPEPDPQKESLMAISHYMYLQGSKALRAQLEQLEQHTNSIDLYVPELPTLLEADNLIAETLKKLNTTNIITHKLQIPFGSIDQPVNTNKKLTVFLAVLVGFILSATLTLIKAAFPRNGKK